MAEVTVAYPDDLAEAVRVSGDRLEAHLRLMAALKLYELGQVSTSLAARVAGLTSQDFLEQAAHYGVSAFNYADDEIEDQLKSDLRAIREVTGR